MSLLTSMLHSATVPLLSSSSTHPDDLPSLPDTASTVSSRSLTPCTTPLSSMSDVVDDTQFASDPEDLFVEASETMPGHEDNSAPAMAENQMMEFGDVNMSTAFQTPDRKRTYEVDSKTITRPKKTSPVGVSLPEVFNQQIQSVASPPPVPIASSTPQAMSTATSASSVSPRPLAAAVAAAAAATPVPAAAAPPPAALGETITKRPADRPAAPRAPRQQTMTVTSALTKDLRATIEHEKASGLDEAAAARLEARILALVQEREREWSAKNEKLGSIMVAQKEEADRAARQAQADIDGLSAMLDSTNAAIEAGFPSSSSSTFGSSLPHLPPAPVIAAMSADKMAELARLKKEIENLESENAKLHSQYNSLYETYSQQRSVIPTLKTTNDELERGIRTERERFEKLKRHAEAKLEDASGENESLRKEMIRMEKAHDDNTLSIRMRLKQREGEIEDLQQNLTLKKRQVSDLKDICNELIKKADGNASDLDQ